MKLIGEPPFLHKKWSKRMVCETCAGQYEVEETDLQAHESDPLKFVWHCPYCERYNFSSGFPNFMVERVRGYIEKRTKNRDVPLEG